MPITSMPLLLFYRTDVFTRLGLQVPNTWQQLISVAEFLNQTSWGAQGNNSSGSDSSANNKYSLCFNPTRLCARAAYMLQSIFASFVQQVGLQPGFLMDPGNLSLLVDTPAMVAALQVYQQLLPYNNPAAADTCYRGDLLFSQGECAMTINFEQFRDTAAYATQEVRANHVPEQFVCKGGNDRQPACSC
jgi:ABC-type glycerol-3-phosphate transport system substrate-binding protein